MTEVAIDLVCRNRLWQDCTFLFRIQSRSQKLFQKQDLVSVFAIEMSESNPSNLNENPTSKCESISKNSFLYLLTKLYQCIC